MAVRPPKQVPAQRADPHSHFWEVGTRPSLACLQAGLVAHCGGHTQGGCLDTLTRTDVATGWTACLPLLQTLEEQWQEEVIRGPFPISVSVEGPLAYPDRAMSTKSPS